MFHKPNAWCIAGLSGSGKSSLQSALAQSPEFQAIESDDLVQRLWNEVGPPKLVEISELSKRGEFISAEKEKKEHMRNLRTVLQRFCASCDWPGFEGAKKLCRLAALLLGCDRGTLIKIIVTDPDCINILVRILAHHESVRLAARRALGNTACILLSDPGFVMREKREGSLGHFRSKNVDPGLCIIQSTRERLLQVASERDASDDGKFWKGRTDTSFFDIAEPYSPDEGFGKVVVIQNNATPEQVAEEIRERLLGHAHTDIPHSPIPFLI